MTDHNRPNFLFIMTDQHRWDWLGCAGHPVVKTPNIDALAAAGTRFGNFHVTSPVCMPNRASFMTGRYPSTHGLRYNGCVLPANTNCFTDVLAAAGYRTASIGKSHLQPFTSDPPLRKEDGKSRLIEEARKPDSAAYSSEQPGSYASERRYAFDLPYYGFQHVDMVTGHGDKCNGHYRQWFRETCPDWETLHDPARELPHNYSCPQAYRTPIPEEFYPTRYVADRAIDWIGERARDTDPFFAYVSFPDPHHPFNPPGKYWDMYHPDQFEVSLPFEAHQNPTPPMQWMDEQWRSGAKTLTKTTACRLGEQQLREAMALTAGMVTMIDDEVGRLVEMLKKTGQYDNTVICFNSDHGDYLGDFSLLLKGAMPFRSVTQVPMIWSDPRSREGRVVEDLASTIDISATILDRVGLVPYHGMQGTSLLPVIEGGSIDRDALLTEFNDQVGRHGFERAPRVRSLRTKDWRLTLYGTEPWGELYDLRSDPQETNNLWDDAAQAGIRAELTLKLAHMLTGQMDESPISRLMA